MGHGNPYTHIRRGPMGGDHYTQIHNGVFRDRSLTPNAKAIFGWISTHVQGWKTSVEDIARELGIGRDATRAALILLKRRGFLVHGRDRAPDGTLGAGWYFLTDLPAQLAEAGVTEDTLIEIAVNEALTRWQQQNTRSEPVADFQYPGDSGEFPQVETKMGKTRYLVQPEQAPRPPKKTKEPQEDQAKEDEKSKTSSSRAMTDVAHTLRELDSDDYDAVYDWVERHADGLTSNEDNLLLAMWEREDPPLKILNTILKQRG